MEVESMMEKGPVAGQSGQEKASTPALLLAPQKM